MIIIQWDFYRFKQAFSQKTGLDLHSYKEGQMERRIKQFMQRHGARTYFDFFAILGKDEKLLGLFVDYLTINTSEFFRDSAVYTYLQKELLPELLHRFNKLSVWSAGCSAGEEPYSLAILIKEMGAAGRSKIVATDIDHRVIEAAHEARYTERHVKPLPPEIRRKYFFQEGANCYVLQPEIKQMVKFKQANLLEEGEEECHLILCRNLFIYLKTDIQEKILNRFAKALPAGGFLIIGSAEYISNLVPFGLEKVKHAIYRRC